MQRELMLIKKLIKKDDIFEKAGLKRIKLETAKEIFSAMNIRLHLISEKKHTWSNALYFPSHTSFLIKARIWKGEKKENFSSFVSFTEISNTKQFNIAEINRILLENFCYKIVEKYLSR